MFKKTHADVTVKKHKALHQSATTLVSLINP